MKYKILTQVDITKSLPLRDDPDMTKQGQQANFNSLRQAIELRGIIVDNDDPEVIEEDGIKWWVYSFNTDRDDVFLKGNDPVGLLVDDLDGIPIISKLNNSEDFKQDVFKTTGKNINTKVQIL